MISVRIRMIRKISVQSKITALIEYCLEVLLHWECFSSPVQFPSVGYRDAEGLWVVNHNRLSHHNFVRQHPNALFWRTDISSSNLFPSHFTLTRYFHWKTSGWHKSVSSTYVKEEQTTIQLMRNVYFSTQQEIIKNLQIFDLLMLCSFLSFRWFMGR